MSKSKSIQISQSARASQALKTSRHPEDFNHETWLVGDLRMHIVVEGPSNGQPVVLLHGFPEFWYGWHHQIGPLAQAGYRVIVPDQRGYNLTEKRGPFDIFTLTRDIVQLIEAFGYQKAHIVGHDWGGMIAWALAALHPAYVDKLVVCNLPHPLAFLYAIRHFYLPQLLKSWYMAFFQLPSIPEYVLSRDDYKYMDSMMQASAPDIFNRTTLSFYHEAWSQPSALTAMLGWYRTLLRGGELKPDHSLVVRMPARLIWGEPDLALDKQVAEWSRQYVNGLDLIYIKDSGHFVQHIHAQLVTDLILEYLSGNKAARDRQL